MVAGTTLYFAATDGSHGVELWKFSPDPPDGDLTGNGVLDIVDVLRALRIVAGIAEPTVADFIRGDVAPLDGNGRPAPDGVIDMDDVLVVLRRMLGVVSW